jgi:hypothetical protein
MGATIREHLGGKNLACWCALPEPGDPDLCHAAVLLELANAPPTPNPSGGAHDATDWATPGAET